MPMTHSSKKASVQLAWFLMGCFSGAYLNNTCSVAESEQIVLLIVRGATLWRATGLAPLDTTYGLSAGELTFGQGR